MSEIIYPQGCRSVTEDLGPDELIRRLKVQSDIPAVINNALHTKYNFKAVFYLTLTFLESFHPCCLSNIEQGQMMLANIVRVKYIL